MNHWTKFFTVAYAEFWGRINFYGLQAVLVLYLTHRLGFSAYQSLNLFGTYVSLAWGITIFGGLFADKISGNFNATVLGSILLFIGNLVLIQPSHLSFYLGLGIIITGIGFSKPSNPTLIGFMCKEDSYLRTKLFSIFYFCLNLGCILGPIIYGLALQIGNFRFCYFLSAFGILSAILILIKQQKSFKEKFEASKTLKVKQILIILFTVCISVLICTFLLLNYSLFFGFLLIFVVFILFYSIKIFNDFSTSEKKSTTALIIPFGSSIIFFVMLLQLYSSITFYIERDLKMHFLNWTIPTAWFSSIESIFVSLLMPILAYLWQWLELKKIINYSESKIILGLFFASCAFFIFAFSTLFTSHLMTTLLFVVLANALLAIGELSIIPISMSLINVHAPEKLKSTFMGMYFFVLMLSGYLAAQIAKLAPSSQIKQISFSEFFIIIAGLLFITGVGMGFYHRFLKSRFFAEEYSAGKGQEVL